MGLDNLVQKAKMFLTSAALVLKYKVDIFETKSSDDAERLQDYGFASQPSEGEGLVIDVGGVVFILRIDRLKDRPQLAKDDVAMWHKDGAVIHLKAGKVIDINCSDFNVTGNAHFKGGALTHNGVNVGSSHKHGGVESGPNSTNTPS